MGRTATSTSRARSEPAYTVPGLELDQAGELLPILQERLDALNELALTLKHVHWNVVGPTFIGVHTMLDPQVEAVRLMVDEVAERMAALGGSPSGTPGALVERRRGKDYPLGRDTVQRHIQELDAAYENVLQAHRECVSSTEEPDPMTQDMLIDQARQLEQFQWMVRAHMESAAGGLERQTGKDGATS